MMKKLLLLLATAMILCVSGYAQKAKFDNVAVKCAKVHLPNYYMEPADRTYRIDVRGAYRNNVENNGTLGGFDYVENNPNLKVVLNIGTFTQAKPELKTKKKEEKDRSGKVTKSWTEYWIESGASMRGYIQVFAQKDPTHLKNADKETTTAEPKKEDENPFLTEDDKSEAAATTEEVEDDANYHRIYNYSREFSEKRNTGTFNNSKSAYDDYNNRIRYELDNMQNDFAQKLYKQLATDGNYQFAYKPFTEQFYMKSIKNDDHPDAKQWNQAVEASKVLFQTAAFDKPVDDLRVKFQPIISYFQSVADKYDVEDRKEAKVKEAALLNMYYILYNLDMHVELMNIANKYLDVKKLGKTAKKHLMKSQDQMKLLTFHQMSCAHLIGNNGASTEELEVVEDNDEDNLNDDE